MVQRQQIHERTESDAPCALRDGREIDAGGRRHAERRRVMLGHVIRAESGSVRGFDEAEARLVEIVAIDVVENAERDLAHRVVSLPARSGAPETVRGGAPASARKTRSDVSG